MLGSNDLLRNAQPELFLRTGANELHQVQPELALRARPELQQPAADLSREPQLTQLQQAALAVAARDPLRQRELIAAVSTAGVVLRQTSDFIARLRRVGIARQLLLIALDEELLAPGGFCDTENVTCVFRPKTKYVWAGSRHPREGASALHARGLTAEPCWVMLDSSLHIYPSLVALSPAVISAMKYSLIAEILEAGANVLLSDTDIYYFDNPFCFLHRDADVEAQTDGGDVVQAYGYFEMVNEPPLFPPWKQQIYFLNAGFFYTRASPTTVAVMRAIADRLAVENLWDQVRCRQGCWQQGRRTSVTAPSPAILPCNEGLLRLLPTPAPSFLSPVRVCILLLDSPSRLQAAFNDELWRPRTPLNSWGRSLDQVEMGLAAALQSRPQDSTSPQPICAAAADKLAWLQRYKALTAVGGRFPRVRVMDLLRFPNSKVALHHYDKLYKSSDGAVCPVLVHANYHLDKAETIRITERLFSSCVVVADRSTCAPAPHSALVVPVVGVAGNGGPSSEAARLRNAASAAVSADLRGVLAESSWEVSPIAGLQPRTVLQLAREQLAAALAAETARGRLEQVPASVRDGIWD
jgi:hypothetical protein